MTKKQTASQIDTTAAELAEILADVPANDQSTSIEALAEVVNQIEAKEDAIAAQADAATGADVNLTGAPTDTDVEEPSLDDLVGAIDKTEKEEMALEIGKQIDARIARLAKERPDNDTQPASLNKSRKKLALPSRAAVLIATGTDPDFIDDSRSSGNHYNVYAIDKVADLVAGLAGDQMGNAINRAVTRSLFAFRAAGEKFTGEHAKAAASDKIRISDKKIASLLIRHTVSAGTAPTQSSSTMQALQTLGIVKNTGSQKFPIYELTDTPQTKKLEAILKAA